ncbi:MAG: hypothetical protein ACK5JS_05135 [Mangrovibacterium sp.]
MKKIFLQTLLLVTLVLGQNASAWAINWPQQIKTSHAEITIYQPQTEELDGVNISSRAAISIKKDGNSPIFGAIWIDAVIENDRNSRTSTVRSIKIPNVKFSDQVSDEDLEKLKKTIIQEVSKWDWQIPTDQLISTYENDLNNKNEEFNNDAPEIVLAYRPSMLIYIDGEPVLEEVDETSHLSQITNTPYCVLKDTKKSVFYVYAEGKWYSSKQLKSGYGVVNNPTGILAEIKQEIDKNNDDEDYSYSTEVLDIIVKDSPAELIQFDGEPKFEPLKGTNLLAITNSDNYLFLDIDSQQYYVVLSGRWYAAHELTSTWNYVPSDELPATFAQIEQGSSSDIVLANVPGTSASRDAILDNSIPQTAEVNRANTSVDVSYDGTPVYQNIDGTSMQYVENSEQTIIRDGNQYYCVDNGIWFVANSPNGPWQVATMRPQQVEKIRPSSPVYNVKYVYIYDVTPDAVYVGYTPGYYGSYVYNRTVIYGTGYYYRPWRGRYYYPRPATFGFNMSYNPWAGWSIGFRWSYSGWYNSSWAYAHSHYHSGGYWGVPAYRPSHTPPHPSRGYYGQRSKPTYYAPRRSQNVYSSHPRGVKTSNINRTSVKGNNRTRNNVYTDRQGNVYQQKGNSWQSRNNSSWNKVNTTRPSTNNRTSNTSGRTNTSNGRVSTNSNNNKGTSGVSTNRPTSNNSGQVNTNNSSNSTNKNNGRNTINNNRGTLNTSNSRPTRNIGNTSSGRATNNVNLSSTTTTKRAATSHVNRTTTTQNLNQAAQNRQRSTTRTTNYKKAVNSRR